MTFENLLLELKNVQLRFRNFFSESISRGGIDKEGYGRFLSFQFHLTQGVQRHFFSLAGHPDVGGTFDNLRKFLVRFAQEEEFHFIIAKDDLKNLGEELSPVPLDVLLWKAYFESCLEKNPFQRLGATCLLENVTGESKDLIKKLLSATYLTKQNTRFVEIHQHEKLPHGDEIIAALREAKLGAEQIKDLHKGLLYAEALYLRMLKWAFWKEGI